MLEIQLIGNLGKDPDARYAVDGTLVVSFPVAVTRRYTRKNGEKVEDTTWVDVTVFGSLAEICNEYLTKGRQVFVRGRPDVRAFTRRDGQPGAALSVIASSVKFLGSKNGAKADNDADHAIDPMDQVPDAGIEIDADDVPF